MFSGVPARNRDEELRRVFCWGVRGPSIAQRADVGAHATYSYWPKWPAAIWLTLGVALLCIGACRQGVPVIDTSPAPAEANGTISGTVRGPEGTSSIDGRVVEVVNVDTGDRQRATTNNAGGFTFKLPPGKYRVEVTLREGESILKQPGVIQLNKSDVDAHADFVLGSVRVSRPRPSPYRSDDGLGSPLA
jgi:hypothetical protein